ncbi:hypothetical protein GCM10010460_33750 [Microbacterium terrae]|uniref:Uncharacterized protein n=2 Tax=Microbacterium terrae TaxID=69369 RepID=A0A0M2GWE5_9MICO|nr:hypothetical protein RS81_02874 [Microbacterium terrae]GLJ98905.1 hypothetical protein GCM10017594_21020 [Microbacterium terrae]
MIHDMDAIAWTILGAVGAVAITLVACAPALKRDQLRRQTAGSAGGALAGIGSGFDAVWRPSAEDANAQWEAQIELPAPAPSPGDGGSIDDGSIVIDLDD